MGTLLDEIAEATCMHALEGLTVLGGEPLAQIEALTALCRGVAPLGLGVIVFSGYRRAEAERRPGFAALWPTLDTLVDGRYDARRPEPAPQQGGRRFIGSTNQRLWHRSDRYRDPALWTGAPRIEVHLDPTGGFSAHGEPATLDALLRALPHRPVR